MAALEQAGSAHLVAIADPALAGRDQANDAGVPRFPGVEEMLQAGLAEGVILATPNHLHESGALACIEAKLPVLVEKPLCDSSEAASSLVAKAEAAGVPLLVGHHRRHNPIAQEAKRIIDNGALGTLTALHAQAWLMKPDSYFQSEWRVGSGGGPILVNLIHDIDLLQYFCGPVASVLAMESNARRGRAVEDTAAIVLRFENAVLGTVNLSDATAAPWSWELTAHENPAYDRTDQNCYWIAGDRASLSIPGLELWRHEEEANWWQPIRRSRIPVARDNPLLRQVEQFANVIRGREAPLVSGTSGLSALRVVEAIKQSAATGVSVSVPR